MTPREIIGPGSLASLAEVVDNLDINRVFLVVDAGAYDASGASDSADPILADLNAVRFSQFEPNPTIEAVERAQALFRANPCDGVVAIGGGTAIDIAKIVSLTTRCEGARSLLLDNNDSSLHGIPLVAIPTTAGTGSEATHFAVLYANGKKHSIADERILPDVAIVDADLTHALPPTITAHTGLDALCQAAESMWSVQSTKISRVYAERALTLAVNHLETAVTGPKTEAREAMSGAAHLAGKAINISFTTGPHAVSYAITSDFGVPHGLAVALTLSAWIRFNAGVTDADCVDPHGVEHVKGVLESMARHLGGSSPTDAARIFQDLLEAISPESRLSHVGVTRDDLDGLVDAVNVQRLTNNPRRTTQETLKMLLEESL